MPVVNKRNIRFRNKPETRIDEFNFIGGLVTDVHETKQEPNQTPDTENINFNETGSIKTRNGYTRYNNDPEGSSSSISNTGASTGVSLLDADGEYVAQTFLTVGAIEVAQIDMYLEMETSGEEQLVRVELWTTSGGEPDAIISGAQSQLLLATGTSEATYNFRFKEPVSLSAATTYAVVVKPNATGTAQTVNGLEVNRTGNDYASGQIYTSTDSGVTWTGDSNYDLRFGIYAGGDTGGTGLLRYYGSGGNKQLFAKFGDTLYRGNDVTGALTSISLGSGASLVAANYIDYTIVNNTLLLVDDSNEIQKYNGSTNSNYSTGTLTATQDSATVTGSGTSWNTSTNAEAGEYIQLPDGKWYRITSIASDTSLTIEVEYKATTQSGQSYVISPWGEVQGKLESATAPASLVTPTPEFIENHANRVWTLEGNTLRFSTLDTSITEEHFNDWDTANNAGQINISSGKGATATGLYSFNNVLYIFQRRAIWGLYGTSPANFELRQITNEIGMIHKRTLAEWNDILIFLSDKGVYLFDGSNLQNISDGRINSTIDAWANKTSATATLWDNKYIIAYSSSGSSYNDAALVYDLTRKIWSKVTGMFASAWSNWVGSTDVGEIYFTSSNQGSIYKWDTGSNDDGYEIYSLYTTPSLGFGASVNEKTMKKFYVQQLALGDWDMTTSMVSDISAGTTTSDISLSPGSTALWDVAVWDTDSWSDEGTILTTRISEFQGIAKFFKFKFEQTGYDEGLEILGVTVTERERRLA